MFAPFSVPVTVRSDGRVIRTFPAQVELEAFADVLVTIRNLPTRSPISLEDVRVERRRLTRPLSNYLVQTAKFNGTKLTRDLRAGSEITTDSIVSVAVIKSGDLVHIEAQAGNAKIMLLGEAMAAGRIGDRIAVKNSQTGASIQATVVDQGKVKVSL
jgi:flagella basal body P-ring formation protein FlgA